MNQFRKSLKEIGVVLGNISAFDVLLNAIVVFFVCYLILTIVGLYAILAVWPALVYAIIALLIKMEDISRHKANIVEKNYIPLREKLRTAVDNIKLSNPIVEALQKEIVGDMRNMRISYFIKRKATSYKILASVLLCFIILFISASDFAIDFKQLADRGKGIVGGVYKIGGDELGEELGDIMAATGGTELTDIYGEESAANLGNEVIDVEIRPISYEINVRDVKDVEEKEFEETILDETCADEGACTPQESFRNEYPKEQQELVKNYFLKISK